MGNQIEVHPVAQQVIIVPIASEYVVHACLKKNSIFPTQTSEKFDSNTE